MRWWLRRKRTAAAVKTTHTSGSSPMAVLRCPRDREELVQEVSGGVVMHGCRRCGGLWLGRAGLTTCLTAAGPAEPHHGPAVANTANPPVPCPVDGRKEMIQHTYGGIQVDVCREHEGIWLDRGELERLAALWRPVRAKAGSRLDAKHISDLVVPRAEEGHEKVTGADIGMCDRQVAHRTAYEAGSWAAMELGVALTRLLLGVFIKL